MLMAPSFMGFMIHIANWRVAFLVLIPIIFILLYLLHGIKKEWRTEKKPVDNIGWSMSVQWSYLRMALLN